jgi:DNA replication protein DnaC
MEQNLINRSLGGETHRQTYPEIDSWGANMPNAIKPALQKMLDRFYSRPAEEQEKIIQEYESIQSEAVPVQMPGQPFPKLPERNMKFHPGQSASREWSNIYENIKKTLFDGKMYAILGKRSRGKSQLGVCLIKYTCRSGRVSDYTEITDLFLRLREAINTLKTSERVAVNEFISPYLLVIDCYETRSGSDHEYRMLNHILDKRYKSMRSTIIISNDTVNGFAQSVGTSVYERIIETGGVVELKGKSFRKKD